MSWSNDRVCPRHSRSLETDTAGPRKETLRPFTHLTWFSVCTTSTRWDWLAITASMWLYATGISSSTPPVPTEAAARYDSQASRRGMAELVFGVHPEKAL
jgi:hypothetical protein